VCGETRKDWIYRDTRTKRTRCPRRTIHNASGRFPVKKGASNGASEGDINSLDSFLSNLGCVLASTSFTTCQSKLHNRSRTKLAVIRSIGGRAVRPFDRALVQGLAHTVPVVANTNISDILRVRKAEGEAFAVYRNAVSAVLREADLSTADAVKDAFMTRIYPELAKLELTARNARRISRRAAAQEIAISMAAVTIGLLVGAVQPTLGAVLTALGGVNAMRTVVDKTADMMGEPKLVRENSFYFLWKLRQRA
jgi:hypothetical protein